MYWIHVKASWTLFKESGTEIDDGSSTAQVTPVKAAEELEECGLTADIQLQIVVG